MKRTESTPSGIWQSFDEMLQASLDRWKTRQDNAEEVIANCIFALKRANDTVYKPANIPLPFDPEILLEVINMDKGFDHTLNVKKDLHIIGIKIEFLILLGCSTRQAVLAIAEWEGISETKAKTGHHIAMEEDFAGDTIGSLLRNLAVAQSFITRSANKAFPVSQAEKAQAAFEKLCLLCDNPVIKESYHQYIMRSAFDYQAIYKLLTTISPDIKTRGQFNIAVG